MIGTGGASVGKWGRRVLANDANPGLTVDQKGSGAIVDFLNDGVSVFKIDTDGAITITGSLDITSVRLEDDGLTIENPANTFLYTVQGAAITAARVLNLPVLDADATFSFIDFAETLSAVKTFSAEPILQDNIAIALGTGSDSRIYYDGTDTIWDLRAVGTGDLMIALAGSFPSPDPNAVHIWAGSAGAVAAQSEAMFILENDGDAHLQFLVPNASVSAVYFGSPASNTRARIQYGGSGASPADTMRFFTSDVERWRMSANSLEAQEAVTIGTSSGNLTLSPSSKVVVQKAIRWDSLVDIQSNQFEISAFGNAMKLNVPTGKEFRLLFNNYVNLIYTTGAFAFQQATKISTSAGDLTLEANSDLVNINPSDTSLMRLRLTSLLTAINGTTESQLQSLDFYTSDSGNEGVQARILGYADTNGRMGLKIIVGSPGVDTEIIKIHSTGVTSWMQSVDSAAVADEVSFGRYEIGAGNTVIALSQETVEAVDTDETKFSHKLQVRINGATRYLMMTDT